jgi:hypothetical protein
MVSSPDQDKAITNGLQIAYHYTLTGVALTLTLALTVLIFAKVFPEFGGELLKFRTALAARRSGITVANAAGSKQADIGKTGT